MKKYMLFDGNFNFDKFVDEVNSMKKYNGIFSVFAHIVRDDEDCYVSGKPVKGSVKVEFYYCDKLLWQLLDMKIRVDRGKSIA